MQIKLNERRSLSHKTRGSLIFITLLSGALLLFPFSTPPLLSAQDKPIKPTVKQKKPLKNNVVKKALNRKAKKKAKKKIFTNKKKAGPKKIRKKRRGPRPTRLASSSGSKKGKATFVGVRNKVTIQKAGAEKWVPARKRSKVGPSDKIKTGRKSIARLKMDDGSRVLLLQNSQAEIDSLSNIKKTIKLLRGRIRAIVKRMKRAQAFKIKTPIGVASVRGTEFEVEYVEGSEEMVVDVLKGQVAVSKLGDLAEEVLLNPGDRIRFGIDGDIGDPIQTGAIPLNRIDVRSEVQISQVKDSVMSLAAEEARNADYQVGKSLIDVDGSRVRVEEYITRPASNMFKLVALNERATRFDYFTYTGTFNTDLPTDLSVALGQVGGKLGTTAPDYYLTDYEMFMSNTKDSIRDTGTGGHLVYIDYDGTNYTITDNGDATNTRSIAAAELQSDGSYKIYNPIKDTFSLVSASNLSEAQNISVLDSGTYRNLTSGDRYWKTRFNTNGFYINGTLKSSYAQTTTANTLAIDLDATFTNPAITAISEFPSGTDKLHNRLSLYYSDGSSLVYDNYIIDDEGTVANTSAFSGLSTSSAYQNELLNWNYQQKVTSDEMGGRSINLVIDPRIGTMSGLIQ